MLFNKKWDDELMFKADLTTQIEDVDYDFSEGYSKLVSAKETHRTIEEAMDDLQNELRPIKEESLLIHAMRLIIELDYRASSPLYKHLQAPMRQTLYMVDVYYSIVDREESVEMDQERWDRIAMLLDEIVMIYLVNIAYPNDGDLFRDERDKHVDVSLVTFMDYFGNAVISYEEQTLDRIVRFFQPYNNLIESRYGFTVDEAIRFILHIRKMNNDKLNVILNSSTEAINRYVKHPEEWEKLTAEFINRGITDPREWWYQPELNGVLKTYQTNPGEIHIHTKEELMDK